MDSTLSTVLAIFLAVILMAIVPLMLSAGQQDNIAQTSVQVLVEEFGSKVATTGRLSADDKSSFEQALGATGNTYEVTIEISILDENPGKKVSDGSVEKIGENVYYIIYTSQVEAELKKGTIALKEGDFIKVEVKNTNTTIFQLFKGFIYQTPSNTATIVGSFSGQIQANGTKQEN